MAGSVGKTPGTQAYLGVTCGLEPVEGQPTTTLRWRWEIRIHHASGQQPQIAARSTNTYPTERDARKDSWAIYHALRRGEGDRQKWGHS